MTSPESDLSSVENRINALLEGKESDCVFTAVSQGSWGAYRDAKHWDLHIWSTVDRLHSRTLALRKPVNPEEPLCGLRQEAFTIGQEDPENQNGSKYRGVATREEVVTILAGWLDGHGRDQVVPKEEPDESGTGGSLTTDRGSIYVTGESAAIFDTHIAAMQRRGAARFTQF